MPDYTERGLHSSPTVLKALEYAPGPILWRTVSSGEIVWHEPSRGKWAATLRIGRYYNNCTN